MNNVDSPLGSNDATKRLRDWRARQDCLGVMNILLSGRAPSRTDILAALELRATHIVRPPRESLIRRSQFPRRLQSRARAQNRSGISKRCGHDKYLDCVRINRRRNSLVGTFSARPNHGSLCANVTISFRPRRFVFQSPT